jgi:hypothetical protein
MKCQERVFRLLIPCAILVITTGCANSPTGARSDETEACRQFVQAFYDWYVPLTQAQTNGTPWGLAVQSKADMFDPGLVRALKADSDAKAQAKGDLIGLDFDPFEGSQDPADHYEARKVTWQGNKCLVEIWPSPADPAEKTGKPDAVAELLRENGHWRFLNFRYPAQNTDLLGILAQP